jgi:hypothetical protein
LGQRVFIARALKISIFRYFSHHYEKGCHNFILLCKNFVNINTILNLKMLCRLCLSRKRDMIEIFGQKGQKLKVAEIISQHFWFQVGSNTSCPFCTYEIFICDSSAIALFLIPRGSYSVGGSEDVSCHRTNKII